MNEQPTKRWCVNPFVNIEAVGEGEDSDEETELAEGTLSTFEFPAPTHVFVMQDVSQDEADLDVSSLALQHAMHDVQHKEQWDSFLTSILNQGKNHDIPLGGQEWLPSGEDCLWEIGCAVSGPFDVNTAGFDCLCR